MKKEEKTLFESKNLPALNDEINSLKSAEQFQTLLNSQPNKADLKTNKFANNAEYIPIGVICNRLDEVYSGLWETTSTISIIVNAVVCNLDLKVFHPVFKVWITRNGIGASAIEVEKGSAPTDFTKVTSKAIEKGSPKAKSEALKNAAKDLGQYFGRGLNRDEITYEPLSEQLSGADTELANRLLVTSTIENKEAWETAIKRANPKALKNIITNLQNKQKHD